MSFITPPVAPAIYIAMGIAKSGLWATGLQAVRLGIVAYIVPFMFVSNRALLLQGSLVEIVVAVVTGGIGVMALAAGVEGYLFRPTAWWRRLLLIAAGMALIAPGWLNAIIALAVIALVVLLQKKSLKRTRPVY